MLKINYLRITKSVLVIFINIVIANFAAQPTFATTYYVDNVLGIDVNDGLGTGSAWKTLAKATTIASAGDTVHVVNNGPTNPFHERLSPARSGTSDNHIRFLGYNGSPYILGSIDYSHNVALGWLWKPSAITGEYYLTLNNGNPGITQARMFATATTSAWNSTGVEALTNRSAGIIGALSAGQWNWGNNDTLGYNTIYYRLASEESDISQLHIEGGEDGAQHRNPILMSWQYIDIENFKVRFSNHHGILNQTLANYVTYNNVDSSFTGRSGLSSGIFTGLTVTNSRFDHNGMISTVRADYTGIQLSGTTNSVIRNNIVSNGNNDSGINVKASSNNNVISNNIIFSNAQHGIDISTSSLNNSLYHNTTYNNGEQGINIETTSTGNVVKNNIMANNLAYQLSIFDSGSTTGLVLDNNLIYFNVPTTNMIRFAGSFYSMNNFSTYQSDKNQDLNSIATSPQFSNTSGNLNLVGDFKLSKDSPAINAGASVGVTSDFLSTAVPQGSSPDIGAYEFKSPEVPSGLSQYQSDGSTSIVSGDWIDATTVVLKFTMSSNNVSDALTPVVELRENSSPLIGTSTNTGSSVLFSATPVTGVVTISGLTRGASYHWQSKVENNVGSSAWVLKGGNPDFGISSLSVDGEVRTQNSTTLVSSPPLTWSCNDSAPTSAPDLFQINVKDKSATIFFSPLENVSKFYLSYSTSSKAEEHGVEFEVGHEGVQQYTINHLQPITTYYFKLRGQNGCMPGQWSDTMAVKTKLAGILRVGEIFKSSSTGDSNQITLAPIVTPLLESSLPGLPQITPQPTPTAKVRSVPFPKKCYFWGLICF